MRKKGFTLIELLVVIAIIAMLLAILMPALSKVKKIAQRVICATNLKGLGTAQVVYANDYDGDYTLQGGGAGHTLANETLNWFAPQKPWKTDIGGITVGASLFLLVREADVSPKSFVCPSGDEGEWDQITGTGANPPDIVEVWDFGGNLANQGSQGPENCVSYSYHQPYNNGYNTSATGNAHRHAASDQQSASFAVMADRNPFFDKKLTINPNAISDNFTEMANFLNWGPSAEKWELQVANAQGHERESQNVLFADGHTSNEKRTDVGSRYDNIYTPWGTNTPGENDRRRGVGGRANFYGFGSEDSVLVNDGFWP